MQVITFSAKQEASKLLRGMATRFANDFSFALVSQDLEEVSTMHNVQSVPAVVVRVADGSVHAYSGSPAAPQLAEWLQQFTKAKDKKCAPRCSCRVAMADCKPGYI